MQLLRTLQLANAEKTKIETHTFEDSTDLTDAQLLDIIEIVQETKIDGVIATNTTLSREGLQSQNHSEVGGLSGKPLKTRATEVIRF